MLENTDHTSKLLENWQKVLEEIRTAEQKAKSPVGSVQLLAVSKFQPLASIHMLVKAGQKDFGENYVQEAVAKQEELATLDPALAQTIRWHTTGPLQKNKVKFVVGASALIHTLADASLADALEKHAAMLGCIQNVLIQVNVGEESQKNGVLAQELIPLALHVCAKPHVRLVGLMCLPPYFGAEAHKNTVFFAQTREMRNALEKELGQKLPILSMGMSADFAFAIAEGATLVRVGTQIFGERPSH